MKLRELLARAGISQGAYDALMRQNVLPFMRRRDKGRGSFQRQHLIALKAFELLRVHGVRSHIAGAAIESAFPAISTFVKTGRARSLAGYKVGARLFAIKGTALASPLTEPIPQTAVLLGLVEFDLRGVDALLPDLPEVDGVVITSASSSALDE